MYTVIKMKKADYSKIAAFYDTGRSHAEAMIDLWLDRILRYTASSKTVELLDLGCGTGRFALPIAEKLNYQVTGADYSEEMLEKAEERDSTGMVEWDLQDAESLTYPDHSFDMVFISHLLHHVDSPFTVIRECNRVLREDGLIFIRYGAIEQIREDPEHIFFPETLPIDEERTPSVRMTETWLKNGGFTGIVSEEILQHTFETGSAHLQATSVKMTSVLTMISQEAFEQGLREMKRHAARHPNDPWLLYDRFTLTVGYTRN